MRVLFLTSPNRECGIYEYGDQLQEAMSQIAPDVHFINLGPDPRVIPPAPTQGETIVHANFQQGTHGVYWNAKVVEDLQRLGYRVVVTQHDTFEQLSIMLDRGFPDFRGADALIVHEPVEGLEGGNVSFLRQGVTCAALPQGSASGLHLRRGDVAGRHVVGSAGFPFPWKGYDALCRASASAGWGVLLLATGATVDQCEGWLALNPEAEIIPQWLPRQEIVQRLSQCDATAWLYTSGNSGTSGAIRLGLAARRPLIAYKNRQFRDLTLPLMEGHGPEGQNTVVEIEDPRILWAEDEHRVDRFLTGLEDVAFRAEQYTQGISNIADRDSWTNVASRYKAIYEGVLR